MRRIKNNILNNGMQLLSSISEQFKTWVTHGKSINKQSIIRF